MPDIRDSAKSEREIESRPPEHFGGIIAVVIIIMLIILGAGGMVGIWLFGEKRLDAESRETENARENLLSVKAELGRAKKDFDRLKESFEKMKTNYTDMKAFYTRQLVERKEIINSYKDYLEMREEQIKLLEEAMQNIATNLRTSHMQLSEKDKIIAKLKKRLEKSEPP